MNINVSGKQIEISEAFNNHVASRLKELSDKYGTTPTDTNVTMMKGSFDFHCDLSLHLGRNVFIRCHSNGSDAYSCFDMAAHKLESRLRKHKKRLADHHRKRDTHPEEQIAPTYLLDIDHQNSSHGEEELSPPIIAEIRSKIPTLTVSEAVMRMDLGDEPAFVFRSASHGRINLVYRRNDGNIAWIDVPKE